MCDCSGSTALGAWGGKVGAQLGDRAYGYGQSALSAGRKRLKNWTGLGDYNITGNSLMANIDQTQGGDLRISTGQRSTRVTNREYLGEVVTGPVQGEFHSQSFRINPANVYTFPWLSPIASQYDQYKAKGILFEFQSTATEYTATTASLGSVIMATDYDVNDKPYSSKSQMLNAAFSQESKMSNSAVHGIECDPHELQRNVFYTRATGVFREQTDRDHDIGIFTIATQGGGLPANQSIGSLYIHYDVELLKEQVYGGIPSKGTLFSTYVTDTLPEPTERSMLGLMGASSGVGIPPSVRLPPKHGVDLGIYVTPDTIGGRVQIHFPVRLQGAYITMMWDYVGTAQVMPDPFQLNTYTNCIGVYNSPPWGGVDGRPYQFWAPNKGATSFKAHMRCAIKLDDVLQETAVLTINDPWISFDVIGSVPLPFQYRWDFRVCSESEATGTLTV